MTESTHSIPLSAIGESPFNPRKTFTDSKLAELAESIKSQGVMQPIVVRPMKQGDIEHSFELVFGHRRFRASKLAGLEYIPAFIRELTDEQVSLQQIHENLEREDVTPLEEAESFQRLMREHKVTADEICKQTGKSRAYVYGRVKAADKLCSEVKAVVAEGTVGMEIAILIARHCATEKQQKEAIKAVVRDEWDYDTQTTVKRALSHRAAELQIRSMFCIRINEAPFDSHDDYLLDDVPSCWKCPKLSGNDPATDPKSDADVCHDSKCYEKKCEEHVARLVREAKKRGQPVLQGDAAKKVIPNQHAYYLGGYTDVTHTAFNEGDEQETRVTFAEAIERAGRKAPKVTLIVHPFKPGMVVRAITDEQADALLAALGKGGDEEGSDDDAPDFNLPPKQRAVWDGISWREVRHAVMRSMASRARVVDELRALLLRELDLGDSNFGYAEEVLGWNIPDHGEEAAALRRQKLAEMNGTDLAALLVMVALGEGPDYDYGATIEERTNARVAWAEAYGVDVLNPAATPTPSTAARAPALATAGAEEEAAETAAPATETATAKPGKKNRKTKPAVAGPVDAQADLLEEAA